MKKKFLFFTLFAVLMFLPIGHLTVAHASTSLDSADQLQSQDPPQVVEGPIGNYKIKANVANAFDEAVKLQIKKVSYDSQLIKKMTKQQDSQILTGLDLSFINQKGKEIEPHGEVKMTINSTKQLPPLKVVHVKDQGQAEILKDQQTQRTVSFSSGSFSVFYLVKDSDDATTLFTHLQDGDDVTLQQDLTISKDASYHILKSSTLDLNDHTLTILNDSSSFVTNNGTTFTIKNGTIKGDGTGKVLEVNSSSTVTLDQVTCDGLSQLCEANNADLMIQNSLIENCKNSDHPTVMVHGGKFTIKDSTFDGNESGNGNGGAIYADHANNHKCIVSIINSNFTKNKSNYQGGAIAFNGCQVTLSNNTFTDNEAHDHGGAVTFLDQVEGTLSNNTFKSNTSKNKGGAISEYNSSLTLSSNTLTSNKASCGGALYVNASTLHITSGTFTSNTATSTNWLKGGGAIYSDGQNTTQLTFSPEKKDDLVFDSNYAEASGGAVLVHGTAHINGGTFKDNTAKIHEGGALTIGYGKATLSKGIFENNKTGYDEKGNAYGKYVDWGGGAIFCSDKGTMNFPTSVVDTGNTAGGFGGGLAGCSTARLYTFGSHTSGIAVYSNAAKQEHASGSGSAKSDDHDYGMGSAVFKNNGSKDIACFLAGSISNTMHGGTKANYHGSVDGKAYTATRQDEFIQCSSVLGLTTDEKGPDSADVIIKNNTSYTYGGGILNNGIMIFGNPTNITQGTSIALKAYKSLKNQQGNTLRINKGAYKFSVKDQKGNVVSKGTVQSSDQSEAEITFDRKLVFYPGDFKGDGPYTFTYTLSEDDVKDQSIKKDDFIYKITVHLKKVSQQM